MRRDEGRRRAALASDRDRVLDAAKAFALLVVVLAHSLAWDLSSGSPASVLDLRPGLGWVTWLLQILPLFFAAGAVANLGSWTRNPQASAFLRRRVQRLGTPALVYATFWTLLLLPIAAVGRIDSIEAVGHFLAQLLWFLGTYGLVVCAVPVTAGWQRRPVPVLVTWLAVIVAVDLLRWQVWDAIGLLNMLLVWGWLHQVGYSLPALRALPRTHTALAGLSLLGVAVLTAWLGPYSSSMVSFAGDPELSNLSPPTVVLALYGLAQVLLLAAAYPWLRRQLGRPTAWLAVAAVGSRAVHIYLWHIPWVAVVAGATWLLGWTPELLSGPWWLLHLGVAVCVLVLAWWIAGLAGRADARLLAGSPGSTGGSHEAPGASATSWTTPAWAVATAVVVLNVSVTGMATWWGPGVAGIPSSAAVNLVVLAIAWLALANRLSEAGATWSGRRPRTASEQRPAAPARPAGSAPTRRSG